MYGDHCEEFVFVYWCSQGYVHSSEIGPAPTFFSNFTDRLFMLKKLKLISHIKHKKKNFLDVIES